MIMSNVVEEETTLPSKEGSINGSSGAALKIPLLSAVVRQGRIRMVEISDHDN